jgi:hypothetical protein
VARVDRVQDQGLVGLGEEGLDVRDHPPPDRDRRGIAQRVGGFLADHRHAAAAGSQRQRDDGLGAVVGDGDRGAVLFLRLLFGAAGVQLGLHGLAEPACPANGHRRQAAFVLVAHASYLDSGGTFGPPSPATFEGPSSYRTGRVARTHLLLPLPLPRPAVSRRAP